MAQISRRMCKRMNLIIIKVGNYSRPCIDEQKLLPSVYVDRVMAGQRFSSLPRGSATVASFIEYSTYLCPTLNITKLHY